MRAGNAIRGSAEIGKVVGLEWKMGGVSEFLSGICQE